jgi:hypothetical protein
MAILNIYRNNKLVSSNLNTCLVDKLNTQLLSIKRTEIISIERDINDDDIVSLLIVSNNRMLSYTGEMNKLGTDLLNDLLLP